MTEPVTVKVCGITCAENAQEMLSLGASYLGINLWPQTPRCASAEHLPELLEAIPRGKRVFVDVQPSLEKLEKYARDFDFFQIHFPAESPERVEAWAKLLGKERLWLAPKRAPETTFPESLLSYADTFLVDAYRKDAFGGTGHTANWGAFKSLQEAYPEKQWILAGGLSPDNIAKAVNSSCARFVDINSGIETAPGMKCPKAFKRLMKAL